MRVNFVNLSWHQCKFNISDDVPATLTGKTLNSPTITTPTITGTLSTAQVARADRTHRG